MRWLKMSEINTELRDSILCIPPYQECITDEFIEKMYQIKEDRELLVNDITNLILSPWRRAYQMEFRYKKTKIFQPFIPVVEYGVFSAVLTDWVSAYLTLLPVVEASLRRWMALEANMSLKSLHKFYYTFGKYSRKYLGTNDEREDITKEYIRYLKHGFRMLFMSFEECHKKNLKEIFNRNLALHRLEGAMEEPESLRNVARILLLLDVISELYLMQEADELWQACISVEPEENVDFQLRRRLYEKKANMETGHTDFLIVQNALVGKSTESKKKKLIQKLKEEVS